jgi:DNA-directed RNA polymerase specialized sigma24 family protein
MRRALLSRLKNESMRAAAILKMEGYANNEIAARLGCVPETVERKLRAIRQLCSKELTYK